MNTKLLEGYPRMTFREALKEVPFDEKVSIGCAAGSGWFYFSRSGKTTTVYTDEAFDDYLVDFNGDGAEIHEESCVAIIDIPFKLNVTREFLEQILSKKEERKNQIYKGVL